MLHLALLYTIAHVSSTFSQARIILCICFISITMSFQTQDFSKLLFFLSQNTAKNNPVSKSPLVSLPLASCSEIPSFFTWVLPYCDVQHDNLHIVTFATSCDKTSFSGHTLFGKLHLQIHHIFIQHLSINTKCKSKCPFCCPIFFYMSAPILWYTAWQFTHSSFCISKQCNKHSTNLLLTVPQYYYQIFHVAIYSTVPFFLHECSYIVMYTMTTFIMSTFLFL